MCISIIYGVKYVDIDLAEEHAYIKQIQVDMVYIIPGENWLAFMALL